MYDFSEILYIVEVAPQFFQVRVSVLEHLTVSSVGSYEKALHCVKEFVINYKTPENFINEMRELVKEDTFKDLSHRRKLWESVPEQFRKDVSSKIEEAYHDQEYRGRKKFQSVSMRLLKEEEEKKTAEVIRKTIVIPKKKTKTKGRKRKTILCPLI